MDSSTIDGLLDGLAKPKIADSSLNTIYTTILSIRKTKIKINGYKSNNYVSGRCSDSSASCGPYDQTYFSSIGTGHHGGDHRGQGPLAGLDEIGRARRDTEFVWKAGRSEIIHLVVKDNSS